MHQKTNTYFLVSSVSVLVPTWGRGQLPLFGKLSKDGVNWTLDLRKAETHKSHNSGGFLQLPEPGHFLSFGLFSSFDVFNRYRFCVINHMYLICSMPNWLEIFQSSSLMAHPWVSGVVFILPHIRSSNESALRNLWSTGVCLGEYSCLECWNPDGGCQGPAPGDPG